MGDLAVKRLQREYNAIRKNPIPNITAKPLEVNILEWHYVIKGTEGTPYEGGYYHGKLKFPSEYPLRPPSVLMLTPSGRFKTNRRLCLSMSDFHPESWNPMWSVSTILTGLYSFMLENSPTLGSMDASVSQRKRLATQSLAFNCSDPQFRELFSDLVDLHRTETEKSNQKDAPGAGGGPTSSSSSDPSSDSPHASSSREGGKDEDALHHRGNESRPLLFAACVGGTIALLALAFVYPY